MSKILDQLKQAEAQRQKIIAERKRLEAEADAALAALEREQRGQPPQPAVPAEATRPEPAPTAAEAERLESARERRRAEDRLLRDAQARAQAEQPRARPDAGQGRWLRASLLAAVVVVLTYFLLPGDGRKAARVAVEPAEGAFQLKLDRDDEGFAARLRARGRE